MKAFDFLIRQARVAAQKSGLDVGALLGVTLQIPAGDVSCAREQRVDAGLQLRRIEEEFRLAILLRHRVVAGDRDLAEGLAIRGDAVAEDSVVNGVGEQGQAQRGREADHDDSLQEMFDTRSQGCAHGVNYTRRVAASDSPSTNRRTIPALPSKQEYPRSLA
jgi:hypothetical protein